MDLPLGNRIMDPLEPWIDAAAARRMAELLLREGGIALSVVPSGQDAGYGPDFVGFEHAEDPVVAEVVPPAPPVMATFQVVHHLPPRAGSSDPQAPNSSYLPHAEIPVSEVISPPPVMAQPVERRGPLLVRLGKFRDALTERTSARGVFILDREGSLVMEDIPLGKLHFLARNLAQACRPAAGQPGNVHVKIGSDSILEVIPVETPSGSLVLGVVVSAPLHANLVAEIVAVLKRAATPGV